MKVYIGFLLLLFGVGVGAEQEDLWREDYGIPPVESSEAETQNDRDYAWLYELLFPQTLRELKPDQSFKSFRVHLRDTLKSFPLPEVIAAKNLSQTTERIEGRITYAGFFRKKYKYDLIRPAPNTVVLNVRVFLEDATAEDLVNFAEKIQQAEAKWNHDRVVMDFDYSFKFELAESDDKAHFSVKVLDETRGPYDQFWSRKWTSVTIAHELGHMLGLGDEYETLTGKMDCLAESLMCASWSGDLMVHHYYFILRRLLLVEG